MMTPIQRILGEGPPLPDTNDRVHPWLFNWIDCLDIRNDSVAELLRIQKTVLVVDDGHLPLLPMHLCSGRQII